MKVRNQSYEARQTRVRYSISDKNTESLRKEPNQKWKQVCLPNNSCVDKDWIFFRKEKTNKI